MKRVQLEMPFIGRKCLNPACGKSLAGKKVHAKTCSPACRKALWRHSPTPKHVRPKEVKPITSNGHKEAKRSPRPRARKGGKS